MNVVLVEPEIPPNTGNIGRLCAATRSKLHLIQPMGFQLDDRQLRRAGMDYWKHVDWQVWPHWTAFADEHPQNQGRFWFVESEGEQSYSEVSYGPEDYLIFGRESSGLPQSLLERHRQQWLRIPMFHPEARSLNLANSVAIVLYESLRQNQFAGESLTPSE